MPFAINKTALRRFYQAAIRKGWPVLLLSVAVIAAFQEQLAVPGFTPLSNQAEERAVSYLQTMVERQLDQRRQAQEQRVRAAAKLKAAEQKLAAERKFSRSVFFHGQPAQGSLAVPVDWEPHYVINETADQLEIIYQPVRGKPVSLLSVVATSTPNSREQWQELGRAGQTVFYYRIGVNVATEPHNARELDAMVADLGLVISSFKVIERRIN